MIHEHEATELASAAIDFGLAPDVQRELDRELAECPVCTERAAAYREQLRFMQRLPVLDASDATRRRVTAAALSGRADTRSPMMLLLAAALIMAALLGVAAVAGALLTREQDDLSVVDVSPSPSASADVVPPSGPPVSPAPADPVGGQVFSDVLEADSIVEVVSDGVRVRSEPRVADDSKMLAPLLKVGDRLFVVEGPVVASDYDWYRVVPVGTDPSRPSTRLPSGWVSRGDHDATPWIAPASTDCPSGSLEIAALNAMHPLERLSCYGGAPLTLHAVIDGGSQSGWIGDLYRSAYLKAAVPDLEVQLEPSAGLPVSSLPDGRAAVLQGAFDSPDCVRFADPRAILDCRTTFMVSRSDVDSIQLADGDFAVTLSGDLRVRAQPRVDGGPGLHAMDEGTKVAVIGGPGVASGYVWFQVTVPSSRLPDGQPLVGWVAAHAKDGTAWLGTDQFDCPPPVELTFEQFAFLTSPAVFHGGLACYGAGGPYAGATLTAEARARVDCSGQSVPGASWLMDRRRSLVLVVDGIEARVAMQSYPGSIPCDQAAGPQLYSAHGHFDDDAAAQCRHGDVEPPARDEVAVYECRSRFVVTDLQALAPPPTPVPTPTPTPTSPPPAP
jgi:hypothetical protein